MVHRFPALWHPETAQPPLPTRLDCEISRLLVASARVPDLSVRAEHLLKCAKHLLERANRTGAGAKFARQRADWDHWVKSTLVAFEGHEQTANSAGKSAGLSVPV